MAISSFLNYNVESHHQVCRCCWPFAFVTDDAITGIGSADVVLTRLDDGATVARDAADRSPRHLRPAKNGVQSDPECFILTESPPGGKSPFQLVVFIDLLKVLIFIVLVI